MNTKRIKDTSKLSHLLLSRPMYFYHDFVECVVRTKPNKEGDVDYWIKYKGRDAELKGTPAINTNIFESVHFYRLSITEKDYNDY